jgi:heme exporter protein D
VIHRVAQVVDPDSARVDVREILDDRRFRSDPAPRPFRGPLRWLGERLDPVWRWIGDVFDFVPGFVWFAIGLAIVGLVIAWIVRRVQPTRRLRAGATADARRADAEDPSDLERAADAAERDGDLERAVRLRFRAGLLRLGDRGAIDYRPSLTTSEVRALLGSETFDHLAATFEHVAYGGRPAEAPDVADARAQWPRVVKEGRRR